MTITGITRFLNSQPWVEPLGWTLVHFLWQGVLIAGIYAVARRSVGRSCTPQLRYLLACAALAAMVAAPIVTYRPEESRSLARHTEPTASVSLSTPDPNSGRMAPELLPAAAAPVWRDNLMPWLVAAWFAGAIVFWARLAGGCIVAARMRSVLVRPAPAEWQRKLDELKTRIRISQPVRLLTSALVQVPTVVGWLRPVVLVPVGALAGLPAEQIEALLAHELAHIRRHDYLINLLQSMAETVLFYHPAVWWVSNQIRNERELCCDDVAVAISGDAFLYARALAGLESRRPAHYTPALAANGGLLPDRIARLLGVSRATSHPLPGSGILVCAIVILATAFGVLAQPAATPAFDAASVKPQPWTEQGGMKITVTGNTLTAEHEDLFDLVKYAYGLSRDMQLSGGPAWAVHAKLAESDLYQVIAKTAGDTPPDTNQFRLMLQTLLADRFRLKVHHVNKDLPAYNLVVANNGPKLKASPDDAQFALNIYSGSPTRLKAVHCPLAKAIFYIENAAGMPVIDKTGLNGLYDFEMEWASNADDTNGPSIFTAIQDRLGLKLEKSTAQFDTIVIDHAEKPSAN